MQVTQLSRPRFKAYDVIVLGSGAGGMTAAAVAAAEGAKVLVIEKTDFAGGTTAWSGGMVWIPANRHMRSADIADSPLNAKEYLAQTVPESTNAELREIFLKRGPEAIDYLEARTELRFVPVQLYPDYYPDLPGATAGGRVLEPLVFDGGKLGAEFSRLRPPLPEFTLLGGMMVNRLDIPHLRRAGRCSIRRCAALSSFPDTPGSGCDGLAGPHCISAMRSLRGSMLPCSRKAWRSCSAQRSIISWSETIVLPGSSLPARRHLSVRAGASCWRPVVSLVMKNCAGSSFHPLQDWSPRRVRAARATG